MLGEIAITPDVFFESGFTNAATADVAWALLSDPLIEEYVVRDLYDGSWYKCLQTSGATLSTRAKHLLKRVGRRLRKVNACGEWPADDCAWCAEALLSAGEFPLDCIVTSAPTKLVYSNHPLVTCADSVDRHPWWTGRSCSVRLTRTTADYVGVLDRVLAASNSIVFIDPYLDPTRNGYDEFFQLLQKCHRTVAPVRIELHRGCSDGSGKNTDIPGLAEYERRFRKELLPKLAGVNIMVDVYVWPEFHDRYLISDLIGISLPNGFDVSKRPNNRTTWSRISRKDRDDIQREFDPSLCPRGTNHGTFTLV